MRAEQILDLIEQYKKEIDCSENSGYMDDLIEWIKPKLKDIESDDHLQDIADAEYRDFCNDRE